MIIKTSLPVVLGYLPVGITFGLLAHQQSYPLSVAMALSLGVYAGASQFIALSFLALLPLSLPQVFLTIWLVNLRHVMMSLAYLPHVTEWTLWQKVRNFSLLTDETFAVLINEEKLRTDPRKTFFVSLLNYLSWNLGTLLGYLGGRFIPDPEVLGLDFALTALFIGILTLFIKKKAHMITFGGSLVLSVLLYGIYDMGKNSLMVAAIISATIGYLWEQRQTSI